MRDKIMGGYNRLTTMSAITETPTLKALCESCGESGCGEFCESHQDNYCKGCPVQKSFQRLSDYEDSGLYPEQVKNLSNLRPEVIVFAQAMEKKLKENEHKGGWKECTTNYLVDKLFEELHEFHRAVFRDDKTLILSEGADVANIVMMLTDIHKTLITGCDSE